MRHTLAILLSAITLSACAAAPVAPPTEPPTTAEQPKADQAEIEACEALLGQLGQLLGQPADEKIVEVAVHQAKTRAEECRAHFKSAADSDEAERLADAFADMIHIRRYDLALGLRASTGNTDGMCLDSKETLARVNVNVLRARQALDGASLSPPGRDTFNLILQQMAAERNAIEPFYRRTCKSGTFDPTRLTNVTDLPQKYESATECEDLAYAYAAFDFEQGEAGQLELLEKMLATGAQECPVLLKAGQVPASVAEAENVGLATMLESAPLALNMALARARSDMGGFCKPLKSHIQLYQARTKRLAEIIQGTRLAPDVLAELHRQQDAALNSLKELESLESMCSI